MGRHVAADGRETQHLSEQEAAGGSGATVWMGSGEASGRKGGGSKGNSSVVLH